MEDHDFSVGITGRKTLEAMLCVLQVGIEGCEDPNILELVEPVMIVIESVLANKQN